MFRAALVVLGFVRWRGKISRMRTWLVAMMIVRVVKASVIAGRREMLVTGARAANGVQADMRPAQDKADTGEPGQSPGPSQPNDVLPPTHQ